jgi:hypothetical protein
MPLAILYRSTDSSRKQAMSGLKETCGDYCKQSKATHISDDAHEGGPNIAGNWV